jgi:3-dehydroquinate dehydratase/shikimate dehydrogenase
MICISIAQESRRFALADMLNAGRQGDLLEVRLDCFDKAPDISELLSAKPKPVIMSCRRARDGGRWQGGEDERLALLRQCIISKADYVEIELDVADQIRKFPPSKRVISYTNLEETPADIADVYAQAESKSPDVIKLVTLARTPEEAWPLVQVLGKATVPTVVVGLGKPGIMLTVLGKKLGAPWTYAALERGMEAYPEQPTARALAEVYHYRTVERGTRLIGVTGFGEAEAVRVALVNAALAHLGLPALCLPLAVGSLRLFWKIMDAVKVPAVLVDAEHRAALLDMAAELDPAAEQTRAVDVLLHKADTWHGHDTLYRAALAALATALRARFPGDNPLKGRMVMIVGASPLARALAFGVKEYDGAPIIASHDRDAAHRIAIVVGCRHIQFEALYSTVHDALVVCDLEQAPGKKGGPGEGAVHPGYLKEGMAVLDLTGGLRPTALVRDAGRMGCTAVGPRTLLLDQVLLQVRLLTGKDVPPKVLAPVLAGMLPDEGDEGAG